MKFIVVLFMSILSYGSHAAYGDLVDLNPASFGNLTGAYNGSVINLNDKNKRKKHKQCQMEVQSLGIENQKQLILNLVRFNNTNTQKKFKLEFGLCNEKNECYLVKSMSLGAEKLNQDILQISISDLSCVVQKLGNQFNRLGFELYENTAFYRFDILLGKNILPISQLITSPMLIPLNADVTHVVRAQIK